MATTHGESVGFASNSALSPSSATMGRQGQCRLLTSGDKLVAYFSGDSILLKPLEVPKEDECKKWLKDARSWAANSGLSEDDVPGIIADVRARHRS